MPAKTAAPINHVIRPPIAGFIQKRYFIVLLNLTSQIKRLSLKNHSQPCGKCVENLIPEGAPDKGVALKMLMQQAGCMKGIFVGDDETDEDVFRLDDANLFTIRVGRRTSSGARFYLRKQNEIFLLLREINNILKQTKE